ncbi:MAG: hypothetical protein V3T40_05035 [Nitrososphaerales archaeon]
MLTIEVFAKESLEAEEIKKIVWSWFKKVPSFYDKGRHAVADHELSLELLEQISSRPEVIAIKGDFLVGASRGPSYEAH